MLNPITIFILTLSFAQCYIPPSYDFNLTNSTGDWHIVGFYSQSTHLEFYSCAKASIAKNDMGVALNIRYINVQNNSYVATSHEYLPEPFNQAYFVSSDITDINSDMIVTYYNATFGEAIIINYNGSYGYILSRDPDVRANDFESRYKTILSSLGIPLNNVSSIHNINCLIYNLTRVNLDRQKLTGQLYGNAVFSAGKDFQGVQCIAPVVTLNDSFIDLQATIEFETTSQLVKDVYYFLYSVTGVLLDTLDEDYPPFVFIYADSVTRTFAAVLGDRSAGFVVSALPTLPEKILNDVKSNFTSNGLPVNDQTFYLLTETDCGKKSFLSW